MAGVTERLSDVCSGDASMTSNRVLSIQSHVVSGYVGNKCAVFPLQVCRLSRFSVSFRIAERLEER